MTLRNVQVQVKGYNWQKHADLDNRHRKKKQMPHVILPHMLIPAFIL